MRQLASERGYAGLEIATDMVANATNILSLATKFWFSRHFGHQISLWVRFKLHVIG